jgi:hypothetical protein
MRLVILIGVLCIQCNIVAQCPNSILPSNDTFCAKTYVINVTISQSVTMFSNDVSRIDLRESENWEPWSPWGSNADIPVGTYGIIEVRSNPLSDGGGTFVLSSQVNIPSCPAGFSNLIIP